MIKKIIAVCFLIFAMAFHGAVLAGSGPNGAGPDVRDPMYYEKTDKVFLGTWECTSDPHSTLTIKEANPQTGGYYVDFFFYRLRRLLRGLFLLPPGPCRRLCQHQRR